MEIISIDGDTATCEMSGIKVNASTALVPDAKPGDYAIIHAGVVIEILDEMEASETIRLFEEIEASWSEEDEKQ